MKRTAIKKRPLSDTTLVGLEPEEKDYRELDGSGLYFLVTKNGTKSWQLRYKNSKGTWTWKGLGPYPQVSGSLARKKASDFLEVLANGGEIKSQAEIKKAQIEQQNKLFKILMGEWLDIKKQLWGESTYERAVKSINKHLIGNFGERDYTTITPHEWLAFFEGLQDTGIYNQVDKLIGWCRSAYDRAKFQKKIMFNPLEGINKQLNSSDGSNMKYVEVHELPQLIHTIRQYPIRSTAIGLELFILLFPRPVELRYAKWEHFDFDNAVWIKPAQIMKKGIAHAVPLSRQVIILLRELGQLRTESDFLFPSRESLNEPVSDNTFNQALNRMGYRGRQNPHGFRHIASTALNNKFSDREQVVESTLAHLKKGVKGVYDKGTHFEERIDLMQWWADYVDQLMGDWDK